MEVWKTCIYNGEVFNGYEVSTMGRVRSLNYGGRGEVQELKLREHTSGYLQVTLCKDSKKKTCYIHRLVGCTWIPNDDNKPTINHLNEDKHDNRVENLQWADMNEQVHHGTFQQRMKKTITEIKGKRVLCVETGQVFDSVKQASEWLGVSKNAIRKACLGKSKTCRGYTWKFVE